MKIHACGQNQKPETRWAKTRNQNRDIRNLCRALILLHTRIIVKLPKLIEYGPFVCSSLFWRKKLTPSDFRRRCLQKTIDPSQKWTVFHAQMEFEDVLWCKIHLRHPILPLGWFKTGYLQNNQNCHGLKSKTPRFARCYNFIDSRLIFSISWFLDRNFALLLFGAVTK